MIILTNESLRNVDKQLGVGHNISIKIFIFKCYLFFRLKAGESLHLGTVTHSRQTINDQTQFCLPFYEINKITLLFIQEWEETAQITTSLGSSRELIKPFTSMYKGQVNPKDFKRKRQVVLLVSSINDDIINILYCKSKYLYLLIFCEILTERVSTIFLVFTFI